jgi:predicted XRE-type DNA-binding protein/uncharacterized protein (DUF433 family)
MSDERRVTAGSGNIHADVGFDDPDLELAKAELAREIVSILEERQLTQKQAAAILGVDQPKISALVNGRLGVFSTERLMRFLTRLDRDVDIAVAMKRPRQPGARIAVLNDFDPLKSDRSASVIRCDPEVMSGTPVFAGTRVPVRILIDYLKAGDDLDQFLDQFPSVTRDLAVAALEELAQATIGSLRGHPPG